MSQSNNFSSEMKYKKVTADQNTIEKLTGQTANHATPCLKSGYCDGLL